MSTVVFLVASAGALGIIVSLMIRGSRQNWPGWPRRPRSDGALTLTGPPWTPLLLGAPGL